jgi:peroxiredoxin
MKRHAYLLSLVLVLISSATAFSQMANSANPSDESKLTAPAFTVTSIDGEKFELAALRGKIVVLNFWFTGCEPCVAELTKLNRLVDKFKAKGVVFIAPALDDIPTLQTFLKEYPFKYHVIPNAGGLILGPYNDGSGNLAFPTHIVIDREGKIDTRLVGVKRFEDLREAISLLVKNYPERLK